jgi:hypothetical protein
MLPFFLLLNFIVLCAEENERETINITLSVFTETTTIGTINNTPVIPFGVPINLLCKITNTSDTNIQIEDPATSQSTIGYCMQEGSSEEISFILNPSSIGATGEITRPLSQIIILNQGESIEFTVELYKHIIDKCFIPGHFTVTVAYEEERSKPCDFIIQFTKESIDSLLPVLNDQTKDTWIRQEAYDWLKKVNPKFEYDFNKKNIEDYIFWWEKQMESVEIDQRIVEINTDNE